MEHPSPSECVTLIRRDHVRAPVRYGIRVDGQRERQRIFEEESWRESAGARRFFDRLRLAAYA